MHHTLYLDQNYIAYGFHDDQDIIVKLHFEICIFYKLTSVEHMYIEMLQLSVVLMVII